MYCWSLAWFEHYFPSMWDELIMGVHNIEQVAVIKDIPKKKKCKEAKWLSEEALN